MAIRNLIFIGPMDLGKIPKTGDTMKNQLFLDRFREVFERVFTVDTMYWRRCPWVLLKLLLLFLHPQTRVVISANPGSADTFIKLLKKLPFSNEIFYWVVGGSFHKMIEEGRFNVETYKWLKGIFVQGQSMVDSLHKQGLDNVIYVANSKLISHYGNVEKVEDGKMHFVFLSRVEEYKGCSDIMASVDALNAKGFEDKYDVTFYGRESEDEEYAIKFKEMVGQRNNVSYKGVLNLRDASNYDVLSSYDMMLFPTYWHGEGFPGIVIDAYISSLPLIASDWNLNKDVIIDGETGWIIPPHDIDALTEKMLFAMCHKDEVKRFSQNCKNAAAQYDSRIVLSEDNLKKIGLLDYA
ncbi:glycosyltransferase [uncultured Prevotella sp.]|uniref:glycosyltransferase n=1 Tax=uncultured Prevotella sp. TaxID=159272 RepID=UPI00258EDC08|nr:glycosyltransferase [uncultured Prevotella sp.]